MTENQKIEVSTEELIRETDELLRKLGTLKAEVAEIPTLQIIEKSEEAPEVANKPIKAKRRKRKTAPKSTKAKEPELTPEQKREALEAELSALYQLRDEKRQTYYEAKNAMREMSRKEQIDRNLYYEKLNEIKRVYYEEIDKLFDSIRSVKAKMDEISKAQ